MRWNEFQFHLARVLAKVDRASMYHSLEVRVPLLDREVIDVAWRTDWRTCLDLQSRIGKQPLRSALARRVRHQIARQAWIRGADVTTWLTRPLRPLVQELLVDRRDLLGVPLRPGAICDVCTHDFMRAIDSKAWGLWLLLSLALWDRTYGGRAMKIALVTNSFPTLSETFIYNHAAGLRAAGLDVTVIAARPSADASDVR